MFFLGSASVFPHAQGLFRQQFVMGEAQLTPVPEDIRSASWPAPSRCRSACTPVHRAGDLVGKTVLVTGGGTIGCMSVIAACAGRRGRGDRGDIAERPLAIAAQVGADRTIRSDQADAASLPTAPTSPSRPPAARPRSPPASRRRGAAGASQVGTLPAEGPHFRPTASWRASSTMSAPSAPRTPSTGRCGLRTRRVDVRPLLSAQLPISRAAEAFELAADRSRSTKVQLVGD